MGPANGESALRVSADPGHSFAGRLRVVNLTARPIVVQIGPSDLLTGPTGGVAYPLVAPRAEGTWLELTATTVHLAGRQATVVTFRGRVPEHIAAGAHYAGFVATEVSTAAPAVRAARDHLSVGRLVRVAVPLTMRTGGPDVRALRLRGARVEVGTGGAWVNIALAHIGTVLIPTTVVRLSLLHDGRRVFGVQQTLGQFFPRTQIGYRLPWEGRLVAGSYRLVGIIRPAGAPPIAVNEPVAVRGSAISSLEHNSPPRASIVTNSSGIPLIIWTFIGVMAMVALLATRGYLRLRARLNDSGS